MNLDTGERHEWAGPQKYYFTVTNPRDPNRLDAPFSSPAAMMLVDEESALIVADRAGHAIYRVPIPLRPV